MTCPPMKEDYLPDIDLPNSGNSFFILFMQVCNSIYIFLQLYMVQVNRLPNLQHKIHLDNNLDKVLQTLQAQEPDVEAIKKKLEHWSAWVRYCQGNPRYVFREFQQVPQVILPGGQAVPGGQLAQVNRRPQLQQHGNQQPQAGAPQRPQHQPRPNH